MSEYLLNDPNRPVGLLPVADPVYPADSHVIRVGVDKEYHTIAAAVAAAHDGDVVLVDAGTYTNDFVHVTARLTIIGVGGMVDMVATVPPPDRKAIMTVGNDLRLENVTFRGAAVSASDGGNGAGIRYEGGNLVLVNDAFYNNQNGLMGGAGWSGAAGSITIDHSLFSGNGSGSGNTHNIYVGQIGNLTVTNSIFEKANVGHELKSRAMANTITNNLFRDGPTGTASYSIDLPNGGQDVVANNVIEKGPMSQNTAMVHFGGEGLPYDGSSLVLTGNTLINDKDQRTIGLLNNTAIAAEVTDNTFVNVSSKTIAVGPAVLDSNVDGKGAAIANVAVLDVLPGSTVTFTDALAHSVTLGGATKAVQGGAGRLTVTSTVGHVIAIGGMGGMDYSETPQAGANQITTKAGTSNTLTLTGYDTVDSRGVDTITIANGNGNITVNGTASILDGTDNDTFAVLGTATITARGGAPVVNVGATGRATVNGALPFLTLSNNGGRADVDVMEGTSRVQASFSGGSVSMLSYRGTSTITTAASASGSTIRLGEGTAVVTSAGKDVIWAGSGKADVIVKGQAEVHAGTGDLAVWGRGSTGATFYGNGGTYTIDGNGGNITYYGGDKASTINARLSNVKLVGGSGRLTITGDAGWQTIVGGTGGITYDGTGGSATVSTAAGSTNSIILGAGSIDSWGSDDIALSMSNNTVNVHGTANILGTTGTGKYIVSGTAILAARGYSDAVDVAAGGSVTMSAGSYLHATETGGQLTVNTSGAYANSVTMKGGSATVFGGTSRASLVQSTAGLSTDITVNSGTTTVTTMGADKIHLGSSTTTLNIMGSGTEVWGESGTTTARIENYTTGNTQYIHGGSGNISLANIGASKIIFDGGSGSANINSVIGFLDIKAGSGNMTVKGGTLGMHFIAGTGTATINPSAAGGEIEFGAGNTTVQQAAWSKAMIYDFANGHGGGTDIINGFRVGTDKLVLQGVGVQSQSVSGGAANLLLTDGTHVQLLGVTSTARLFV